MGLETAREEQVTCNAICPGYVLTDLVKNQLEDTSRARGIPVVRPAHICLSTEAPEPLSVYKSAIYRHV